MPASEQKYPLRSSLLAENALTLFELMYSNTEINAFHLENGILNEIRQGDKLISE